MTPASSSTICAKIFRLDLKTVSRRLSAHAVILYRTRRILFFLDITDSVIEVKAVGAERKLKAMHGLFRSLINNMVIGVTNGFTKSLEIVGVGYRAEADKQNLTLNVGYSNPKVLPIPEGLTIEVEKNTIIHVRGIDKQQVGEMAAKIRRVRKPEPYRGKGIRYMGELIRRKVGKAGSK